MKKFIAAALALVLMAAMFTGCGCTNSAAPTETITRPTVMPTTQPTMPSTEATMPSQPSMPAEGQGPTGAAGATDATGATEHSGTTETTTPMTKESGRVRSHINGDF